MRPIWDFSGSDFQMGCTNAYKYCLFDRDSQAGRPRQRHWVPRRRSQFSSRVSSADESCWLPPSRKPADPGESRKYFKKCCFGVHAQQMGGMPPSSSQGVHAAIAPVGHPVLVGRPEMLQALVSGAAHPSHPPKPVLPCLPHHLLSRNSWQGSTARAGSHWGLAPWFLTLVYY